MFHKIISGLSYSPALVESLSKLATSLKMEVKLRLVGVVFLILGLLIQVLVLAFPPSASNLANINDNFYGGFGSLDKFMTGYDNNDQHLRDLLTSLGITRYDILQAKATSDQPTKPIHSVGSLAGITSQQDKLFEYRVSGDITDTSRQTAYVKPGQQISPKQLIYSGQTQQSNWFGINMNNGDILVEQLPANLSLEGVCPVKPLPKPQDCGLYYNQTAHNQTKSAPAEDQPAENDDHIIYSLTVTNPESATKAINLPFKLNLADALEYSKVLDSGGGLYDSQSGTITWADLSLQPGQSVTHTISLVLMHDLPATSTGLSNQASYDCQMTTNLALSTLTVPVKCPVIKQFENLTSTLPKLSPSLLITEAIVVILVIYLYLRARQTKEEVRLIRKDLNSGAL